MACVELRDSLRINIAETRHLNRDKVINSKRKAIQDVVDVGRYITNGEVITVGNKLKHKSAVQIQDLALLKLSFVQSIDNIEAFLKINGALHALVRELSSSKSDYQLAAAECCCNLALGNAKCCLLVAKAAGPYLLASLNGSYFNLISVSVWSLGNLCASGKKTWMVLHSQGFLAKLLKLVESNDVCWDVQVRKDIQENSLGALVQLLHVGIEAKLLTPEDIESITKTISTLENSPVKSLRVLEFLLSCLDNADCQLLECKTPLKCLKFLEQTELNNETVGSLTAAVRTLANLVTDSSGSCAQEIFTNWGLLQDTVQKIFSSPFPHLIKEMGWLLGNLMNHPSQEVQSSMRGLSFDFQIFASQMAFFDT